MPELKYILGLCTPIIICGIVAVLHSGHFQEDSQAMEAHHEHGDAPGGDMMAMQMWFYNGIEVTLWFKAWKATTMNQYFLGMLGLIAFGVLHEALACYRSNYMANVLNHSTFSEATIDALSNRHRIKVCTVDKLALAGLYCLSTVSSYLLMLAIMTYNVGYCLAVVMGMGLGYILFFDQAANALSTGQIGSQKDSCHARLIDAL